MNERLEAAGAVAFVTALVMTPLLRSIARRAGYLDVPGEHSSHRRPVPRSGGYAIFAAVVIAAGVAGSYADRGMAAIIIGAAVLACVAAVDEFTALPRFSRLLVQIGGGAAIAYGGHVVLEHVALPFVDVRFGPLAGVVTVIWIVGMINAYNFMDGLNGMASMEGMAAGLGMALLALNAGDMPAAVLGVAIAGACAGFLPWNLPSGSIFMGDVGSASLGLLLALLSLRLAHDGVLFVAAALPLLPFAFDSGVTIARRAAHGERFFATRHRSHFYQRLNGTGYSHTHVTMTYGALAAACVAASLIYSPLGATAKAALLATLAGMHVAFAAWVTARETR